jgi:hypothetical protein
MKMSKEEIGPGEQFYNEIYNVFLRWWEESDLDEDDMRAISMQAVEKFCDNSVQFDSDIDLSDVEDE